MGISYDDNNDVQIAGGTDGTLIGNVSDSLKVAVSGTSTTSETELPTFSILLASAATAQAKSMLSLVNASGSTVKIKLRDIRLINTQNTAVTGVVCDFNLYRCTSHNSGNVVTISTHDTTDTISASVTARTAATIVGESTPSLRHWDMSTDEWGSGAQDVESNDHMFQLYTPGLPTPAKCKPITLNANEGITIKCETNTTTGLLDILLIFTQE